MGGWRLPSSSAAAGNVRTESHVRNVSEDTDENDNSRLEMDL